MASKQAIAFIDSSVEAYESLIAGIRPEIQVHILDSHQDGIEAISGILQAKDADPAIEAIHLISHGSPGWLQLGSAVLSLETLARYRRLLQSWASQHILIYGCQVAAGDAGAEFIEQLHAITQAEIFASSTLVGHGDLGGNWLLDVSAGNTPPSEQASPSQPQQLAFDAGVLANYSHTLPGPIAPDASTSPTFNAIALGFSAPTVTHPNGNSFIGQQGTRATYQSVGTYKGQGVDMTITILSTNDTNWSGSANSPKFSVVDNDAKFNFSTAATSGVTTTTLRFEFWQAGAIGTTRLAVPLGFNIKDLDNTGTSGKVSVLRSQVSTFGVNDPTKLVPPADPNATNLIFTSTANNPDENNAEFALQVNYELQNTIDIALTAEFGNSGFVFDGDRQFKFDKLLTTGGDQFSTRRDQILTIASSTSDGGKSYSGGILANDYDSDGGTISVKNIQGKLGDTPTPVGSSLTLASGALLTVNTDGSFSYDPNDRFPTGGEDSFVYTVQDNEGNTDNATVTIRLTDFTNVAPVLDLDGTDSAGQNYTTTVFGTNTVALTSATATATDANAPDIESLTLSVTGLKDGVNEILKLGSSNFSLNADANGSVSVSGIGSPVQVILRNGGSTIQLSKANGTAFSQTEANSLLRNLNYQNIATNPQAGDRIFSFLANDGEANSNLATSTLTVDGALKDDAISINENAGLQIINVLANDPSPSGTTPSIETGPDPTKGSATVNNNQIEYTPNPHFSGVDELTYRVGSDVANLTITVKPVAETPVITANDVTDGVENRAIALNLSVNPLQDQDGSETLSYEISGVPIGASFQDGSNGAVGTDLGNGIWGFTPAELVGLRLVPPTDFFGNIPLSFKVTSTDRADLDGNPSIVSPGEEDQKTTTQSFNVTVLEDSDGDGTPNVDEPPVIDLNGSAAGVDYAATFVAGSGTAIALTDPNSATGSDPTGDDIESISLSIAGLVDGNQELLLVGNTAIALDGTTSASNLSVANTATTFSLTQAAGTVTLTRQGGGKLSTGEVEALLRALSYRHDAAQPGLGDRTFAFTASDGNQSSNIARSTVSISVTLQNDSLIVSENAAAQVVDAQQNDSLGGSISITNDPGNGTASLTNDNKIRYQPNPNFSGIDTLTYTVGGQTAELNITVLPLAETPVVTVDDPDQTIVGVQNQPLILPLKGSTPTDNDGSESFRFELTGVPTGVSFSDGSNSVGNDAGGGTWIFSQNELTGLTLVPPTTLTGSLNLSFRGISTDQADLNGNGNTLDTNEQSVAASTPVPFTVILQTDSDGDGTPDVDEPPVVDLNGADIGIDYQTSFAAQGAAVAIALSNGATATDPSGDDIESLRLELAGLDSSNEFLLVGPTAIALNTPSSSTLTVPGASIDVDATIVPGTAPGTATLSLTKSGTGDRNFTQADINQLLRALGYRNDSAKPGLGDRTLTVIANDGSQDSAPATSRIQITAELRDDATTLDEGTTQSIDVLANDQRSGQIKLSSLPGNGQATVNNGKIDYTPNPGFSGIDRFVYEVDGQTAEVVITVNPVANAPTPSPANSSGSQDTPLPLNLNPISPSDTDGSERITYELSGIPDGFGFSDRSGNPVGVRQGNGTWVFQPEELAGLQLLPPAGFSGSLSPTLLAVSTDTADLNGDGDRNDPGESVSDRSTPVPFSLTFLAPVPQGPEQPKGDSKDKIVGGPGRDIINGLSDNDELDGGGGDDVVNGGSEQDEVIGGEGNDQLNGGSGDDRMNGGNGNDIVSGGSGNDTIAGELGNDVVNGGSGNDIIDGGEGDDTLIGGSGNDAIYGREGMDFIQGGRGDDLLVGGGSADRLLGGQGRDRFRYEASSDFGDTILDFEIVQDQIDLSAIYGGSGSFGSSVSASQLGAHTSLLADVGNGPQPLALLLNVNAFSLNASHFLF